MQKMQKTRTQQYHKPRFVSLNCEQCHVSAHPSGELSFTQQQQQQQQQWCCQSQCFGFFSRLGKRLTDEFGDSQETSFLMQRQSVVLQRFFNDVLVHESFHDADEETGLKSF